jgi:hypothetical protein
MIVAAGSVGASTRIAPSLVVGHGWDPSCAALAGSSERGPEVGRGEPRLGDRLSGARSYGRPRRGRLPLAVRDRRVAAFAHRVTQSCRHRLTTVCPGGGSGVHRLTVQNGTDWAQWLSCVEVTRFRPAEECLCALRRASNMARSLISINAELVMTALEVAAQWCQRGVNKSDPGKAHFFRSAPVDRRFRKPGPGAGLCALLLGASKRWRAEPARSRCARIARPASFSASR